MISRPGLEPADDSMCDDVPSNYELGLVCQRVKNARSGMGTVLTVLEHRFCAPLVKLY